MQGRALSVGHHTDGGEQLRRIRDVVDARVPRGNLLQQIDAPDQLFRPLQPQLRQDFAQVAGHRAQIARHAQLGDPDSALLPDPAARRRRGGPACSVHQSPRGGSDCVVMPPEQVPLRQPWQQTHRSRHQRRGRQRNFSAPSANPSPRRATVRNPPSTAPSRGHAAVPDQHLMRTRRARAPRQSRVLEVDDAAPRRCRPRTRVTSMRRRPSRHRRQSCRR